jgi:hypothetical protein
MSKPNEQRQIATTLGLLLDDLPASGSVRDLDWRALLPIAQENAILIRLADRLAALDETVPDYVADAVAAERSRSRVALGLLKQIGRNCQRSGLAYVFPKGLQHHPDRAADLDLLVLVPSERVDRQILRGLPAVPKARTVKRRIARQSVYGFAGHDVELNIFHGRLGLLGEDRRFPKELLRNRRLQNVDGVSYRMPSPEDQLILRGIQRVWGRRSLRLTDVFYAMNLLRRSSLDWPSLVRRARTVHALHSLSCFLTYVSQIHEDVFGRYLLPPEARRRLKLGHRWGRVEFRAGRFRFPVARVYRRTYAWRFLAAVGSGDWAGVGRLGLLPLVATTRRVPEPGTS